MYSEVGRCGVSQTAVQVGYFPVCPLFIPVYLLFTRRLSVVYPPFIRYLTAVYPRFIRYLAAVYPPFIRGFSVVYSAVYP